MKYFFKLLLTKELIFISTILVSCISVAVFAKQPTIPRYNEVTRTLEIPVVQLKESRTGAVIHLNENGTYTIELVPLWCGFSPINELCNVQ